MTPEKIKPKFILDHIDDLRKAGVADDLVDAVERLADRCIPRKAAGGGCNAKGNELRFRCPTCGKVIKGPQYNTTNAEDRICSNCKQHIDWWNEEIA